MAQDICAKTTNLQINVGCQERAEMMLMSMKMTWQ